MLSGVRQPFSVSDTKTTPTQHCFIGENILRGIDFAVEEINAKGGINGKMLEVVRGDHAGDPATGRSEAERLITQEHVDVIMGCHMSVVTEVVAMVCTQYKVPFTTRLYCWLLFG